EEKVYNVLGENNPDVKSVVTNIDHNASNPEHPDFTATPHKGRITVNFVEYGKRTGNTQDLLDEFRKMFAGGIAGGTLTVDKEASGPPTGAAVDIRISGDDF